MFYENIFFSSLSNLTIEPDSMQSERDISSEDSPPEKPVNGKHTSILPSQVPSHLLMISILEHLCQMYAQDAEQGKKLFQGKNKKSPKVYYSVYNYEKKSFLKGGVVIDWSCPPRFS